MNISFFMNATKYSDAALEKALAAELEEVLRGVNWLRGWQVKRAADTAAAGFDLLGTVPLPGGGKAALCVECKAELRPNRSFLCWRFRGCHRAWPSCAQSMAGVGLISRGITGWTFQVCSSSNTPAVNRSMRRHAPPQI